MNALQTSIAMAVTIGVLGLGSVAQGQTPGQETLEKQMGPQGNAMGVPVPGSANDMETTEKQPDASKLQSSKTIPRLPYSVQGEILNIEGQNYVIRDKAGERVSLVVNTDTNLDCAAAPTASGQGGMQSDTITSERKGPKEQAPKASEQQLAQGQRKDETARGSGFRIGKCDFKAGDVVKAEVDDNGRVTTLKYLASSSASGSSKGQK